MKKLVGLFVMAGAMAMSGSAFAESSGVCGDNLTWVLDDSGTLTISGTGKMTADHGDDSYDWNEKRNSIKKVIIEDGVTGLSNYAFEYCVNLESIEIPDSVTVIGLEAFGKCRSLSDIEIPDSVTVIGYDAFNDTPYYNNKEYWENGVLYIGSHLIKADETVTGTYEIKPGTTSVAIRAFEESTISNVKIPDGMKGIGACAFKNCGNLNDIMIPDSVTTIGEAAFINTAYYKDETNWEDGVLYIGNHVIEAQRDIAGEYAIKSGTISIAEAAFFECTELEGVTIPESVDYIGASAFRDCHNLAEIVLPENMEVIGEWAFRECDFSEIHIPKGLTYIADNTFDACVKLTNIVIPDGVTSIGMNAFDGCKNMLSIEIPDSVTYIGSFAFAECSKLTEINIPDKVTVLKKYVFGGCDGFVEFEIPDTITEIENGAFFACENLVSVKLPEKLTAIRVSVFELCKSLSAIEIPDGVTVIEDYAFAECKKVSEIVIPKSVTTVYEAAFNSCDNLKTVYYCGSEEEWNAITMWERNETLDSAVKVYNYEPVEGVRIIAQYCNGRLVDVRTKDYSVGEVNYDKSVEADTVKVMVWKAANSLEPVCDVGVIN